MTETSLEQAERHVREGRVLVARQQEIVAEMIRDNHPRMVNQARRLLVNLEQALKLATDHLQLERSRQSD